MLGYVGFLCSFSVCLVAGPAYAHSAIDDEELVETVDNKYQIAFEMYPKFASAGQNSTLHFSIHDKNNSNINGVYAAIIMKEKDSGRIVEQIPYRFYEFGDISIPYNIHDNEDYVATLLARINGDSKYQAIPLRVDFEIPFGQTTIISPYQFLPMAIAFTAALAGGIVFLFKRK